MSRPLIGLKYNVLMNEDDIRALTGGKAADAYVHIKIDVPPFSKCKYAVIEFKGSAIKKALDQLEASVDALRKNNYKVDYTIITLKGRLNKRERKLFSIQNNKLCRRVGRGKKEHKIDNSIPVYVFKKGR